MNLGRLLFMPPQFRPVAAQIAIQQPRWFAAAICERRSFLSLSDMQAYEAGVRAFQARGEIGAIGSPHWMGYRDAEAAASARTQGAAQ